MSSLKAYTKKRLSVEQWEYLKKNKIKFSGFFRSVVVGLLNFLPKKLLIFLKANIRTTGKLDYEKKEIFLHVNSKIEYNTRLRSCWKEPEMINWIEGVFQKGEVFYDIGANVGAYSLVAAKYFQEDIRVFAFEPAFHNYAQLNSNIHINGCDKIIAALPLAMSEKTCLEEFHYSSLVTGSAFNTLGSTVDYKGETFDPVFHQKVLSFSIDDLVEKFTLPAPNHIKIDVDGLEFAILKGAQKTLSENNFRSIMVEIYEEDTETLEIIKFLEAQGLTLQSKYKYIDGGDEGPASKLYNYYFQK